MDRIDSLGDTVEQIGAKRGSSAAHGVSTPSSELAAKDEQVGGLVTGAIFGQARQQRWWRLRRQMQW
jgi:hypothetical protein